MRGKFFAVSFVTFVVAVVFVSAVFLSDAFGESDSLSNQQTYGLGDNAGQDGDFSLSENDTSDNESGEDNLQVESFVLISFDHVYELCKDTWKTSATISFGEVVVPEVRGYREGQLLFYNYGDAAIIEIYIESGFERIMPNQIAQLPVGQYVLRPAGVGGIDRIVLLYLDVVPRELKIDFFAPEISVVYGNAFELQVVISSSSVNYTAEYWDGFEFYSGITLLASDGDLITIDLYPVADMAGIYLISKILDVGAYTLGFSNIFDNPNFVITFGVAELIVNKAQLTVEGIIIANGLEGQRQAGLANASLSELVLLNIVLDDEVYLKSITLEFVTTAAGRGIAVRLASYVLGGERGGMYTLVIPEGLAGNIYRNTITQSQVGVRLVSNSLIPYGYNFDIDIRDDHRALRQQFRSPLSGLRIYFAANMALLSVFDGGQFGGQASDGFGSLQAGGNQGQSAQFRLYIPMSVGINTNRNISAYVIGQGGFELVTASIEGDYLVFETNQLGLIVIGSRMSNVEIFLLVLGVVGIIIIFYAYFFVIVPARKRAKAKGVKLEPKLAADGAAVDMDKNESIEELSYEEKQGLAPLRLALDEVYFADIPEDFEYDDEIRQILDDSQLELGKMQAEKMQEGDAVIEIEGKSQEAAAGSEGGSRVEVHAANLDTVVKMYDSQSGNAGDILDHDAGYADEADDYIGIDNLAMEAALAGTVAQNDVGDTAAEKLDREENQA